MAELGQQTNGNPQSHDANDHVPLWIDNEAVVTSKALHFEVKSTATKKVWMASGADAHVARRAAESAAAAFPAWSQTHPTHRRKLLIKAADLVRSRRETIVETMMSETNTGADWANGVNLDSAAAFLEELASLTTTSAVGSIPTTGSEGECCSTHAS